MSQGNCNGSRGGARAADLEEAALAYATGGWPVLPLFEITDDGGCACGDATCEHAGNHPRIPGGVENATTDFQVISAWWQKWPLANIGVRTGDGFIVVDVDRPEGEWSLAALEKKYFSLPETLTQLSGSGGRQLFFRIPRRVRIPSRRGLGPNLDLRGDDTYVVVAPSMHRSGHEYLWMNDRPLARLRPMWVSRLQLQPAARRAATCRDDRGSKTPMSGGATTMSVPSELLDRFFQPNAERIAKLSERREIAVCVRGPSAKNREMLRAIGWDGSATVFRLSRAARRRTAEYCLNVLGDAVTHRWLTKPVKRGAVRVFVFMNDTTLLMNRTDKGWELEPGSTAAGRAQGLH